jgi:hypothetical protein
MRTTKILFIASLVVFLIALFSTSAASSSSKTPSDNETNLKYLQSDLDALKFKPILTVKEVQNKQYNKNFSKLTWTSLNNSNFFVMDTTQKSRIKFTHSKK